jgi:GNAT superfamily N-acetyltransferase
MPHPDSTYPLVDLSLARRLERAEASANAAFVTARARLQPEIGATWTDVAGAYAMFDGVDSPITQTFGMGLFADVGEAEFDALEAFFHEHGAEVNHEISPLAAPALLPHLNERGYLPVDFTGVMFRPLALAPPSAAAPDGVQVRRIGADEGKLWARVAAEGWSSESPDIAAFVREMGQVSARAEGTFCFVAELDGEPAGAGLLSIAQGTALLSGASTIPAARRRGVQRALLEARLRFAVEQGCDLVMICAHPGSASQRNAERQGFRIAYTRIKWHLAAPSARD